MKRNWTGAYLSRSGEAVLCLPDGDSAPRGKTDGDFRVALAIGMEDLYAQRVEIPNAAMRSTEKYLPALVDVKLPVPVESCALAHGSVADGSVMTFAVPLKRLRAIGDAFKSRHGFAPGRILPAPLVLWEMCLSGAGSVKDACAIVHLHAGEGMWTLLAGTVRPGGADGGLFSVSSLAPGDVAGVRRNCRILLSKAAAPLREFTMSGSGLTPGLGEEIGEIAPGTKPEAVPGHEDFLPQAAAHFGFGPHAAFPVDGAEKSIAGFAASRRTVASLLALCLCSFALFIASLAAGIAASARLDLADRELAKAAASLAGRPLPMPGPQAMRLAANEFESRLDPMVEVFARRDVLSSLRSVFAFASVRGFSVSGISFDGNALDVLLGGASPEAVRALAGTLEANGYLADIGGGVREDGTCNLEISDGEGLQ